MRHADIEQVGNELMLQVNTDYLIITLGGEGSICFTKDGNTIRTPALATKVVDIIGAGDAFFSYTAPCFAKGMSPEIVSFIGNVVGALAVQIVGNKKPVEKHELLELVDTLYKIKEQL
jgi:sugar/nucleoside kinase (ribokinase family)